MSSLSVAPTGLVAPVEAPPHIPHPAPHDLACRLATALVAATTGVSVEVLLGRHRSTAPVASARQLAMYLAHVALGQTQTEVAQAFQRDRTTVAHACRRIEDMRDDAPFDRQVGRMEDCLRWAMEH